MHLLWQLLLYQEGKDHSYEHMQWEPKKSKEVEQSSIVYSEPNLSLEINIKLLIDSLSCVSSSPHPMYDPYACGDPHKAQTKNRSHMMFTHMV